MSGFRSGPWAASCLAVVVASVGLRADEPARPASASTTQPAAPVAPDQNGRLAAVACNWLDHACGGEGCPVSAVFGTLSPDATPTNLDRALRLALAGTPSRDRDETAAENDDQGAPPLEDRIVGAHVVRNDPVMLVLMVTYERGTDEAGAVFIEPYAANGRAPVRRRAFHAALARPGKHVGFVLVGHRGGREKLETEHLLLRMEERGTRRVLCERVFDYPKVWGEPTIGPGPAPRAIGEAVSAGFGRIPGLVCEWLGHGCEGEDCVVVRTFAELPPDASNLDVERALDRVYQSLRRTRSDPPRGTDDRTNGDGGGDRILACHIVAETEDRIALLVRYEREDPTTKYVALQAYVVDENGRPGRVRYRYNHARLDRNMAMVVVGPSLRYEPYHTEQILIRMEENDTRRVLCERAFHIPKEWGPRKAEDAVAAAVQPPRPPQDSSLPAPGKRPPGVGDPAPDFEAQSLDGEPVRLSDFRGRYVLLDFWATWCGPCIRETPHLQAVWKEFGDDPRFVLLAASLDRTPEDVVKYVEKHDIAWAQVWLGRTRGWPAVHAFGQRGIPSIYLICPEGKLLTGRLRGPSMVHTVREHMGPPRTHGE